VSQAEIVIDWHSFIPGIRGKFWYIGQTILAVLVMKVLKGIDPLLSPELLHILASMGHGDELLIADANFPAEALAQRLARLPGADTTMALKAILTVFPLDQYVEQPAAVMAVVDDPAALPDTVREFQAALDAVQGGPVAVERVERFAFYERAREAFAIVATGERRLYGNLILSKGVVNPGE
jgi:L-fucose mutarotase